MHSYRASVVVAGVVLLGCRVLVVQESVSGVVAVRALPQLPQAVQVVGCGVQDPGVLRAAVRENGGNVGVYASVVQPGRVRRGDVVALGEG